MNRRSSTLLAALLASSAPAVAQEGFSITLNGNQVAGDRSVAAEVRRTDQALRDADVQIQFDGLETTPRLSLGLTPSRDTVTVQSALNYPAYVTRGELRVIDPSALGGTVVARYEITPGGALTIPRPEGDDLVLTLRVYDAQGRYDETAPQPIDTATQTGREPEGFDGTETRRIPLRGGQVTVSGRDVAPGATVLVLGEPVATDGTGRFVLDRILPVGRHGVDVRISGGGQTLAFDRTIEIPAAQWFTVATADLTIGWRREDGGDWDRFDSGRLAFFVDGRTAAGTRITASADSGEGDIADLFSRYSDRDPRSLLLRVDPRDLYPTYGDDSTTEDRTPTSGNLYLRIERDGNFLLWGDFEARLSPAGYVISDRTLYGLSARVATQGQTQSGEPRASATFYAAQPDLLPQRDVLRGTGGSVFFLSRQDIARATETLLVQVRDDASGRVISSRQLVAGRDYDINYVQGVVTLRSPLSSGTSTGIIQSGDDEDVVLVAQYEFRPDAGDVDGYAVGARAEAWVTDTIRIGASGLQDETGTADQTLYGLDLTYRPSETAEVRLDWARSDGPGFAESTSFDGGLIFDTGDLATGTGEAVRIEGRAAWLDLGVAADGGLAAYYERRTEGFSTPTTQVTAATGDETLWGLELDYQPGQTTRFSLSYENYEAGAGTYERVGTAEFETALSGTITLGTALEFRDLNTASEVGTRTDLGLRLTYSTHESAEIYVFGQATLDRDGLDPNNRGGVGGRAQFGNGWELTGEISGGDGGPGARLTANQSQEDGSSRYFGYELDPTRTLTGVDLVGSDRGRLVFGGRETVNSDVAIFGENSYDLFGQHRTLTSTYGIDFTPSEGLSTTVTVELGQVTGDPDTDFERRALTFGLAYDTEAWSAAARIEYRREEGLRSGDDIESDTLLISADGQYKINEDQRLVFSIDHAQSTSDDSAILEGNLTDVVLGYAYRPAESDRLTVLARYRYLNDEYGQQIDDTDERGPRQESHVFSIDASYDLDPHWTIGGKLGARISESSPAEGEPFAQNDAWLAVASLRYHALGKWDLLLEARHFEASDAGFAETSFLGAAYYQIAPHVQVGLGYNFGSFSDDLTDLVRDDEGVFLNLVASY